MNKLNRKEMIDILVEKDKEDIALMISRGQYGFIDAVLRGDMGWKQYSYLTDEEIESEYNEYISESLENYDKYIRNGKEKS